MVKPQQTRIRVDLWTSLKSVIESEMARSGLTAQEVVNIALVDYFGLSPSGKKQIKEVIHQENTTNGITSVNTTTDTEDYI